MPDIAGLKLIVPTSVSATGAGSSASVSASGKVTFTSAVTVSIDGCFTSAYDNALAVVAVSNATGNQDIEMRLRASGSDATGSNYTYQRLLASSTTVSGSRSSGSSVAAVSLSGTTKSGFHIYFYGPNLAQPTAMRTVTVCRSGNDTAIADFAITHSLSTAYDGFTLRNDNSYAMTGTCTIYGLSQ